MNDQENFARQAIELARHARLAGNHPFGALLVVDGEVVLTAQNTVTTDRDPTAHAETKLVAKAIRQLSPDQIGAPSSTPAVNRVRCASARCTGPEFGRSRTPFLPRNWHCLLDETS